MAKQETEGLVLLLDVGLSMSTKIGNTSTTYLQSCVDIIQMIVQRKMFQKSKDEIGLVLFGTRETANELWDGTSDHYSHVTMARPLSIVDWKMLDFIQNKISVSNLEGDVLDGLVVASNHFHEDMNKKKYFIEKRIIIFTDFSSSTEGDDKLNEICDGLSKYSIRVDVISPFVEPDDQNDHNNRDTPKSSKSQDNETKCMTRSQLNVYNILRQICNQTEGALYSFDEALTLLSIYQSKSIKSAGTKYQFNIGDKFKLPIVSMIKCKENKPELFKFKKVYAKDESVELKIDRARFTKDDEQRDLDDKTDVVDAYRYGSTYVPIDADSASLRLEVEKCFSLLGFTKSENVRRYYYLSDAVHQIVPDPSGGNECEEAFVSMVRAMYNEDVYGVVRKVYNSRSSPELGCLIPYISSETTCLFYITMPFEDDIRKFTLENFNLNKKFKPNEKQLNLIDDLIDSMDLSKNVKKEKDEDEQDDDDDEEEEELYDPHTTFNPYIQRMFQSIALRATNPQQELPDFENHITNTHLIKIGSIIRNDSTLNLIKRCAEEFPTKIEIKKQKKTDENIFEKKKQQNEKDLIQENKLDEEHKEDLANLDEILKTNSTAIKRVGTVTPVDDFKQLVDKLSEDEFNENFEELCLQLQVLIKDFFAESLQQIDLSESTVHMFQQKCFECLKIHRDYSAKFKSSKLFNNFMKTFKVYLINESKKPNFLKHVENFWNKFIIDSKLSLITISECDYSDIKIGDEFLSNLLDKKQEDNSNKEDSKENVEDLLDLM